MGSEPDAANCVGITVKDHWSRCSQRACRSRCPWYAALCASIVALCACDGSLQVSGRLTENRCELSLWAIRGPIWGEAKPLKVRFSAISQAFNEHWTISGPATNHWLQIACPGKKRFRSKEFDAPRGDLNIELGDVALEAE